MADASSPIILADTSVLINFLAVDRLDLIERHGSRFMITDHVGQEVLTHYAEQFARLQNALTQGILEPISVTAQEEVETFAQLTGAGRLGHGECSAIAVAAHRGYTLAIDDKRARKQALALRSTLQVIATQDLMLSMIKTGLLSANDADAIKNEWETRYRFKLAFNSFADLL